ncbi:hypothetical protein Tco_0411261 [Tanacetum coccineum]
MQNPKDISDPTTIIDMALVLMAKEFTLNDTTPINNNQRSSSNLATCRLHNRNPGVENVGNYNRLSVDTGIANQYGIGNVVTARAEANGNGINGNQIRCYNCQGVDHYASNAQYKARKGEMCCACEETERANAKCTLGNNLQQASTSGTQSDKAPVYDSDGSAEVHLSKNCYDNDIFNIVEQGWVNREQLLYVEEPWRHESLFHNLAAEVEKVNSVNRKMKETNAELTTELARYKNQVKCLKCSQEKILTKLNGVIADVAAKFVRDFKSLANETNESIAKQKALELEIKCLLRAVVSQDIMSIVQCNSVVDTSNLQTELERTKEHFKNCIIKKENKYAKLWNDCWEIKKGKSKDTSYVSNTLDPLSQKLENENVELEYQVQNYEKENVHLKTAYKNLFDTIKVTRTQTKAIIDSLQDKLHDTIYENAKLRAQLFDKVYEQKDTNKGTSANTKFAKQSILGKPPSYSSPKLYVVTPLPKSMAFPKVGEMNALSNPVTSNSSRESTVVNNERVIAPGFFRINPFKASRVDNFVPNKHVKARVRTKPIIVSQPHDDCVRQYVNGMKSRKKNQLKALLGRRIRPQS